MARDTKVDTRQESPLEYSDTYKKALIEQLLGNIQPLPGNYYTPASKPQPYDPNMPRMPDRKRGPMTMPSYDGQVGGGVPGRDY